MKKLTLLFALLLALAGCSGASEKPAAPAAEREQSGLSVRSGMVQHVRSVKIGDSAGKNARKAEGLEITILLDTGQEVVVVQEADDFFKKGDRVRLLTGGDGRSRAQNE